jgi:hypothetical protein
MRYFYFLAVIVFVSCSGPRLAIRKNPAITDLGVSVTYDLATPTPVQKNVEYNVDKFISDYNKDSRRLRLYRTVNPDSSALAIHFLGTRLVSRGQQVTGVVVSIVGFSMPFILLSSGADFYFFFYYFPRVVSVTNFSLSPDINASAANPVQYIIHSPGFLKKQERQIEKHGPYFNKHLRRIMRDIENSRK